MCSGDAGGYDDDIDDPLDYRAGNDDFHYAAYKRVYDNVQPFYDAAYQLDDHGFAYHYPAPIDHHNCADHDNHDCADYDAPDNDEFDHVDHDDFDQLDPA